MHELLIHSQQLAVSTLQVADQRVETSWPWYIIRGAGFTAAGLLVLQVLSGIGQVTGIIYRYFEPIKVWAIHRALAYSLLVAIAFHGGFLLIDHFVSFNIVQLLIPFVSHYNNGTKFLGLPLGAIAVTLGILAMYGVIIIVLSSLGWIDSRRRTWKTLHFLSYFVAFFIFLHALYVGTDLRYGVFRKAWITIGTVVAVAMILRLYRAGTMKKKTN